MQHHIPVILDFIWSLMQASLELRGERRLGGEVNVPLLV